MSYGRKTLLVYAMAMACLGQAGHASAMVLVWDIPNFAVNVASFKQLVAMNHQLTNADKGTVNYYTQQIDNSTRNIDQSTTSIDTSTKLIDKSTQASLTIDQTNLQIDTSFKWVINNHYNSGEIIPIPRGVEHFFEKLTNEAGTQAYADTYRSAEAYGKGSIGAETAYEGSRARKDANDIWLQSIDSHRDNLTGEAEAMKKLTALTTETMGRGQQQQIANAIASSQVNQLMQLRSMLLVSEAARLAESQVSADREARAIAVGTSLREDLDGGTDRIRAAGAADGVESF